MVGASNPVQSLYEIEFMNGEIGIKMSNFRKQCAIILVRFQGHEKIEKKLDLRPVFF